MEQRRERGLPALVEGKMPSLHCFLRAGAALVEGRMPSLHCFLRAGAAASGSENVQGHS